MFFQEKLFFLEEEDGKTMLEEAYALGQLDTTFFMGTMMMNEGRQRKQEALDLLSDTYNKTNGTWNLRETCSKVSIQLNREGKKQLDFHGCYKACVQRSSMQSLTGDFVQGYKWRFKCENFLWEACFVIFSGKFGINYEQFVDACFILCQVMMCTLFWFNI